MNFVVKVLFFTIRNEATHHCTLFNPLKEGIVAVKPVFNEGFVED